MYTDNWEHYWENKQMTNRDKFEQVFGMRADISNCPTEECCMCPCNPKSTLVILSQECHPSDWWASEYIEEPKGEWIKQRTDKTHYTYICSVCGHKAEFRKGNYCPNCGTRMKK